MTGRDGLAGLHRGSGAEGMVEEALESGVYAPLIMSLRWPFRMQVLLLRSWPRSHFATAMAFGSGAPGWIGTCWLCWTCPPCCCCAAAACCWASCCCCRWWFWKACCLSWLMYCSSVMPAFLASASSCWRCQSWNCWGVMPRFCASTAICCWMAAICCGVGCCPGAGGAFIVG